MVEIQNQNFEPEKVLSSLDARERVAILAGLDFWHTTPLPRHNVPKVRSSDGASGIRGTRWFEGVRAALLPCGTGLAATWDKSLLREAGELLGAECRAKGVHCWLGPTINIQRSPLGGRGYESYSEDPHLTGVLASQVILGCESTGTIAAVKHYLCNDQETDKAALNAMVTERALREVYLRPFQIVARDARPGALMTSYNKINGVPVSQSKHLLQEVVRDEWAWNPLIMSDWLGTYSTNEALDAGLDLEMPGPTLFRGKLAQLAASSNAVKRSVIDQRALRVLQFVKQASRAAVSEQEEELNRPEDRQLNRRLAQSSIVLLQNQRGILPLPRKVRKVALIGSHMKDASSYSTGATALEPYYTVHPFDAIKEQLSDDVETVYEVGAYTHKMLPLIDDRAMSNSKLHLFNEPWQTETQTPVDTIPLKRTFFHLLDYVNPALDPVVFYGSLEGDFAPDATGQWKFGLTVHGTAKLYINEELIVDNTTSQRHGTSFLSSGTVEEFGMKMLEVGKLYKIRVEFGSASTSPLEESSDGSIQFPGGGARLGACLELAPHEAIQRAVDAAKDCDYAIVCTGLSGEWESEGFDRPDMNLPPAVDKLIDSLTSVCPSTIVVNRTGMPVSMPWASKAAAVLQAWYGGNESGNAIADVLFGDFNPCGKMPVSWPRKLSDNPSYLSFGSKARVLFGEDVYVGYRWYDKLGHAPLWSFGYGLSYTTFALGDVQVTASDVVDCRPRIRVSAVIANTGQVSGAEVVQVWVSAIDSTVQRPSRELHGFEKVSLQAGEEERLDLSIDQYAMAYWDEVESRWCVEQGRYLITLVASAGAEGMPSRAETVVEVKNTSYWNGL